MRKFNRHSFTFRLMIAFILVAIVPVIMLSIYAYNRTIQIYEKNVDEVTRVYLNQTVQSVKTVLSSYEDLAYQIYTNETAAELAVKIDNGEDFEVSKNQMLHLMRGYAFVKPYVLYVFPERRRMERNSYG